MQEEWRQFRNTHYSASNTGKIRNDKTGRLLKPRITERGYCNVTIDRKCFRWHRVIAECFIPNPDNLPQINHKDENKTNNIPENLEWCDNRYNKTYSTGKPVEQLKDGVVIARYKSITLAAEGTGIERKHISGCLNTRDRRKSAGGFKWRFC